MKKFWRITRKYRWRLSRRDIFMISIGLLVMLAGFRISEFVHNKRTPLAAESTAITTPWIPPTVKQWHDTIETMAKRYNVDPNLIAIIMTMESGGYAQADSGQAQGLMQITPGTAHDIATRYLKQPVQLYDLKNPTTSIEFGTAYLAKLRDLYGTPDQGSSWMGTVELIAAAYNGGFGAANSLEQGQGIHDTQTIVYSRDAFNMWRERYAKDSPTFDRWKERGGITLLDNAQADMQTQTNR
jgi:hypothetical protein